MTAAGANHASASLYNLLPVPMLRVGRRRNIAFFPTAAGIKRALVPGAYHGLAVLSLNPHLRSSFPCSTSGVFLNERDTTVFLFV